jgi:hypothetical protein
MTPKMQINDSKNAEHAGEHEAQKQDSGTAIKQWTCYGSHVTFGRTQCCTFAASMLTGLTNKARVREQNWIFMGHMCHNQSRYLHLFYSYVTGHLPRTHPLVENETMDDRALEGVWLGNELSTPMFWLYSFKLRKVVR